MKKWEIKSYKQVDIPVERKSELIRNLMCAVLSTAVEDYCGESSETAKKNLPKYFFDPTIIMKDLQSKRLRDLTDDMSLTVACQLKRNPNKIKERLKLMVTDYNTIKVERHDKPVFN
jgi:hypothetical protein